MNCVSVGRGRTSTSIDQWCEFDELFPEYRCRGYVTGEHNALTAVDRVEGHCFVVFSRVFDRTPALFTLQLSTMQSIFRRVERDEWGTPRAFGSTFGARLTAGTISNWAKRDVRTVRTRALPASQSAYGCRFDNLRLSRKPRTSTTMVMTSWILAAGKGETVRLVITLFKLNIVRDTPRLNYFRNYFSTRAIFPFQIRAFVRNVFDLRFVGQPSTRAKRIFQTFV